MPSRIRLFATPWTVVCQASMSMGFPRQEYWSWKHSLPQGLFPARGLNPGLLHWNAEWSRAKTNRVLPRKCTGQSKHPLPTTQEKTTHGHHQTVNTEIRLIIFFTAEDGEALYTQQKQDRKLTVAQIMKSLLLNSDLNWRKEGKPLDHSGMT